MARIQVKRNIGLLIIMLLSICLYACGNSSEETTQTVVNIARNDYYGGITRIMQIQTDTSNVVKALDSRNYNIIVGNPSDYWSDDYFFLNFDPVDSSYIPYTIYLNEEQTWDEITANITATIGTADKIDVTKLMANQYNIEWVRYDVHPKSSDTVYETKDLKCTYDASHDWLQMIETTSVYNDTEPYEEAIYEFAELSPGVYVIQNEKERLYVEYNSDGILKKMYYSVLGNEERQTTEVITHTEEVEKINLVTLETFTEEVSSDEVEEVYGRMPSHYNSQDDTIFTDLAAIDAEWVLKEPTIEEYIIFENDVLTFRVKNALTGELEGFSVANEIPKPIYNEKTGLYYDPETGVITTIEEYNARVAAMNEETENAIAKENEEKNNKDVSENENNETEYIPAIYSLIISKAEDGTYIYTLETGDILNTTGTILHITEDTDAVLFTDEAGNQYAASAESVSNACDGDIINVCSLTDYLYIANVQKK